jgi:hypothetical protein
VGPQRRCFHDRYYPSTSSDSKRRVGAYTVHLVMRPCLQLHHHNNYLLSHTSGSWLVLRRFRNDIDLAERTIAHGGRLYVASLSQSSSLHDSSEFLTLPVQSDAIMVTQKTTMASLPLEILEQIAARLEAAHRPSLIDFSLASKACYNAAAFLVFRNISIMIETPEGLQRDAGRLLETLLRTDAARHVYSITVRGAFRLDTKKTDTSDTGSRRPWKPDIAEILDEEEYVHYSGEENAGCRYVVYDERVIEESSAEDMAWAPFLDVLEATVGLRDLIYECRNQLPPSLLRTLHKQHPSCRLHHLTFRFRTLLWGVPYPYEMELATSPSLYRVNVVYTDQDSDADFDYNADAVMELAAGLAPNLKEVTILEIHSPLASSQRSERRPPWQGLPGYSREMVGSLTSLSVLQPERDVLQKWAKHTDFTKLQHLRIGKSLCGTSLGVSGEEMEWTAQNISFPSLKTLCINLDRSDDINEKPNYCDNAINFFRSLEPLEGLSIHGPMEPRMLKVVLTHHGPTLKKLSMVPDEPRTNMRDRKQIPLTFTEDRVMQIQALCPVLENLMIPVCRDKSSTSEAAIYRRFGEMASLRFLFLILDCATWRIDRDPTYYPQFEGEDDQVITSIHYCIVKRGHLRDHFINSAVDEGLARSIWMKIAQNKIGKRLERLKLWTKGTFRTGPVEYGLTDTFTKNTARSWLIERSPPDDREEATVKELMQRAREEQRLFVPAVEHRDPNATGADKFVKEVIETFESIWPPKPDSRDWRDDWASFPLQD